MTPTISKIDISENTLRNRGRILEILLGDKTTGKNILWATDSYVNRGKDYQPQKQILHEQITGLNGKLIQPRAAKSREEQIARTKGKAEVFTPLKVVKEMNMAINWAGGNWPVSENNWLNYIRETRLEITCGEAPFIAGRYNPTANTGAIIKPANRVGFLDNKLQIIGEFVDNKADWLEHAETALKASYGYEWQGDNLLIARENILQTIDDFYRDKFGGRNKLSTEQLEHFAEIIAWNIFQMDGINYVIPMTRVMEKRKVVEDGTGMFSAAMLGEEKREYTVEVKKEGRKVKIMDWQTGKPVYFYKLLEMKS